MAHPGGQPITKRLRSESRPTHIHVLTGPEGGFTESEVAEATRCGAHIVSLGPTIMRAETAPIIALGSINALYWEG